MRLTNNKSVKYKLKKTMISKIWSCGNLLCLCDPSVSNGLHIDKKCSDGSKFIKDDKRNLIYKLNRSMCNSLSTITSLIIYHHLTFFESEINLRVLLAGFVYILYISEKEGSVFSYVLSTCAACVDGSATLQTVLCQMDY